MIGFSFLNGIWFLVPVLVWNVVFSPRLTQEGFRANHLVPKWILAAETVFRFAVFAFPVLLPLTADNPYLAAGLTVYAFGIAVYFLSWVPLMRNPRGAWSRSAAGILAPHVSPLILFTGIAMIGQSPLYAALAGVFTVFHVLVALHGFRFIRPRIAGRTQANSSPGRELKQAGIKRKRR